MNKIKRVSFWFRIFFQMLFIALPILLIVSWIYAPRPLILLPGIIQANSLPVTYPETAILHILSPIEKFFGFLVSMMPLLIELFILHSLIALFRLYENGKIFSVRHVKYLRNIGYALLIGQLIIEPIYQLLIGLVLTFHNPKGHRFMAITFTGTNIGILLTALLIILISWIMAEAFKLQEEQELTI